MRMIWRVLIAAGGVLILIGGLGMVKGLQIGRMIAQGEAFVQPEQTVTEAQVERADWEQTLSAVGSLKAVQGMTVTAELSGKITRIEFEAGAWVSQGQVLLQQDISEEKAQLFAAISKAALAHKDLTRARLLQRENVIPVSDLDNRQAAYEQASAEADNVRAIIEKKTIKAPFAGRLGIRQVDLGEVLESGQAIVSLQSMDPIYVNFQLPQQELSKLEPGLAVRVKVNEDTSSDRQGGITTVNPEVDSTTRNVRVQATLANQDERLRPGMYVSVTIVMPVKRSVLTIPATAVLHAPYSDSVFIIDAQKDKTGRSQRVLRQQFVKLGEKQGDYIAVNKGLDAGQRVVSTGVFKLRNGMAVVVNNNHSPTFKLTPQPDNS